MSMPNITEFPDSVKKLFPEPDQSRLQAGSITRIHRICLCIYASVMMVLAEIILSITKRKNINHLKGGRLRRCYGNYR